MSPPLEIYDPRERAIVGAADAVLRLGAMGTRLLPSRPVVLPPRRVLLLRLERIGDLLMTLDAIEAVRQLFPAADVDLVVGSWNRELAGLIPGLHEVRTLDAPWLARGSADASWWGMLGFARSLRSRGYDLAINFEGDIRSNAILATSGAPVRVGFPQAGGGAFLTAQVEHDPDRHTASNAVALVARAAAIAGDREGEARLTALAGRIATSTDTRIPPDRRAAAGGVPGHWPRLSLPAEALARADRLIGAGGRSRAPIGVHAGGGREIKQWHPARFGEVASTLARERDAAIVFTGNAGDRAIVAEARRAVAPGVPVIVLPEDLDLVTLAALLARLEVLVTGDTGPMHLAAAMGTPIVAVFGPSMPWRYAPLSPAVRVVRVDLDCSPCNRIRLPPERCVGHVPDCLDGIRADLVVAAARDLLRVAHRERPTA